MNLFRRLIRPNSFLSRNGKYIIIFLNGFLLASLVYFYIEKQYEKGLFTAMASFVKSQVVNHPSDSQAGKEDSLLTKSVHLVHQICEYRMPVFVANNISGVKANVIAPVSVDLMTAQGACGSHAYVLARLLQEMDIETRIPQMTVEGQSAGHIIVEAKTSAGWVVMDALSDVFFRKPDGQLAGFKDVHSNWEYYKQQLPADYNMAYRYEGVRYTNWDKVPVIMPLLKNVMYLAVGKEKTDSYSIRSLGLKKNNILFNLTLGAYLIVMLFSINLYLKAKKKAALTTAAPDATVAPVPVQPI
jgi:hypothetical protein